MIGILKKDELLLNVAVVIIMLLTFVRDVMGVGVNQYALLAVIAFFLFTLRKQQCMNYTFFLLALLSGIQGLTVTVAILALMIKTRNENHQFWLFAAVLLLLEALNDLFLGSLDAEFAKKMLLYSSNIFLFFYLLYFSNKDFNYIQPVKLYLVGAAYVMCIILFRSISISGIAGLLNDMTRIGLRSVYEETTVLGTEFQMNPNSLAFYSLFSVTVLISFAKQLNFRPLLFYMMLAVAALAGILSFSRTWLVCIILYFVFLVIFKKKNGRELIIALIAVVILFAFCGPFLDSVYNVFLDRFTSESMETAGQRTDIFRDYNKWMFDHNLFISGIGILYYMDVTQLGHSIHSGMQQIFVGYGFLGLLLFFIVAVFYKRLFLKKTNVAIFLPFLICFIFDQSIQFLSNPILLFPFVMLAYTLRIEPIKLLK